MSKDNKRFFYIQAAKRKKTMGTEAQALEALNELTNKEHMASIGEAKPLTAEERLDKLYATRKVFVCSEHKEER